MEALADQMRTGVQIKDPVGWLIARGLPQRQECGDARCDDRLLLDSGQDCPRCEDRQVDRHAQRHAVAAAVDAAMPGASAAERWAATVQQLHENRDRPGRGPRPAEWEQVRARQAAGAQARAEARPRSWPDRTTRAGRNKRVAAPMPSPGGPIHSEGVAESVLVPSATAGLEALSPSA